MASIKIICNPKTPIKGSNKRSIVLFVTHNRRWFSITLHCEPIEPEFLVCQDNGTAYISKTAKNYLNREYTNNYLLSEFEKTKNIILELQTQGILNEYDCKQLSVYIREYGKQDCKQKGASFFDVFDMYLKEKTAVNAINTAKSMSVTKRSLQAFSKTVNIENIDYSFLKKYETWYLAKGNSYNGLAVNMRYIRTVYNRAIKEGFVNESLYPFKNYKIKTQKTVKRALTQNQLQKLIEYKTTCKSEQLAKDVFLFSFYCAGINLKDIAFLKKENLKNDRLVYSRGKTADKFNYKLCPQACDILNRYSADPFLFPIITKPDENVITHFYNNRYHKINHYMKQIGEKLEFPIPLTSYVARHTFATIAKQKNIPITVISELFGHEDIKTTQIYMKDLESSVLDNYLTEITTL